MQFVYFLFLPSALLSNQLLRFATNQPTTREPSLTIDWHAGLNMWFVIGCFALTARWLEKSQRRAVDANVNCNGNASLLAPIWMLRNRESLLLWLWCLLQPICLVASGWTQWTQRMPWAASSQAVSIMVLLAPSVVLLLLVELIRCSRSVRNDCIRSSTPRNLASFRTEVTRTIANTWLVPLTLPLIIAGLADLGTLTKLAGPDLGLFETVVWTLVAATLVTVVLPHLFTRLIGAGPIDESIALAIESAWRKGSGNVPRILHWPTGCRMANAAVVGLFGYGRKLLLTDALLQRLNERELSMVVLHELAHCVRQHAWIRMLPTLVSVAMLFGAMTFLSGVWLSLCCVTTLGLFVACLIAICWWTEFDADRYAIELAVRSEKGASREKILLVHASELCDALSKIYGSRNMERSSWMHPSCARRIAAIRNLV